MTPRDKAITMLKKSELMYTLLRNTRDTLKGGIPQGKRILNKFKLKMPSTNSPVEQLLCDYGFDKLSRIVKSKRLEQLALIA
jgi:hypothetical protein